MKSVGQVLLLSSFGPLCQRTSSFQQDSYSVSQYRMAFQGRHFGVSRRSRCPDDIVFAQPSITLGKAVRELPGNDRTHNVIFDGQRVQLTAEVVEF
jgi:hypothetical protein